MPSSSLVSSLTDRLSTIFRPHYPARNAPNTYIITLSVALILTSLLRNTLATWTDYKQWLLLGPGGPPRNLLGYLIQNSLRSFYASPDRRSTAVYDEQMKSSELERRTYLPDGFELPFRQGSTPVVGDWVAPSRQLSARASGEMLEVCLHSLLTFERRIRTVYIY